MQQLPAIPDILKLKSVSSGPRRSQDTWLIILFLMPAFILFMLFVIYPIFRSIYFSMFDWNGLGPAVDFVGLENFIAILTDAVFLKAIRNVLLIIVFSLGLQLPAALVLAVMVGRGLPGRGIFRTIFFMPYVLSEVNVAIMWMLLYTNDPERGLLNGVITALGGHPVAWLADPNIALLSVFIALTWKYFGFHMLLYLAGLQNIPLEIEEAARIDGASSVQNFFYITLPLLGSTIRTSVYLSVLGSLQQFILVWIMTKGGPINASETLATYMYRFGFVRFQLGYGSAVAIYMFLFCLIFSLIYQRLTRQPDYLTGL
ncbi:MAG: sugar ABC transporter permease [Chloroflexi bacterium]|nr:MAG: sugar ABC transporter permease [Chloroflexota bacterium]RPI96902.1 MAG: sugar ABC transporter permease [Chloroflexota bacterium]